MSRDVLDRLIADDGVWQAGSLSYDPRRGVPETAAGGWSCGESWTTCGCERAVRARSGDGAGWCHSRWKRNSSEEEEMIRCSEGSDTRRAWWW